MEDETTEELLQQSAEGARNFMLGMALDPRLPTDMKKALADKATEIDTQIEAATGFA